MSFKTIYDSIFGVQPVTTNPLDSTSKVVYTNISVSASDSAGLIIDTGGSTKKNVNSFFVVSTESAKTSDLVSDTFDDNRRKLSKPNRDHLNFYIEMVDSSLKTVDLPTSNTNIKLRGLRLGVNPSSLSINSAKIINRFQTLTRWVEEHWGDELDSISLQGSTLAFILFENQSVLGNVNGGLNTSERNLTTPYQELQSLVRIFQSNGLIFQGEKDTDLNGNIQLTVVPVEGSDDVVEFPSHPRIGLIKERLYIKLSYDYGEFIGYFESFDIVEDSAKPFSLTYSINFKAEKVVWK